MMPFFLLDDGKTFSEFYLYFLAKKEVLLDNMYADDPNIGAANAQILEWFLLGATFYLFRRKE